MVFYHRREWKLPFIPSSIWKIELSMLWSAPFPFLEGLGNDQMLNIDQLILAWIQPAFNYELNDWAYSLLQQYVVLNRRWQRNGYEIEPHSLRYSHGRDVTPEVGVFQLLWGIFPVTPRTWVALISAWNNYWSVLPVSEALLRCPIACHVLLVFYMNDFIIFPGEYYFRQNIEKHS